MKRFPKEEAYSLSDPIRRSSRCTGAQIAEARAKRRYAKHVASKLTASGVEQPEIQPWTEIAFDCKYISQGELLPPLEKCNEIGRLLGGMIANPEQFCNPSPHPSREGQADYFVTPS